MIYPNLDPVAFYLFTWPVYWYGLMYLLAFVGGWGLLTLRLHFAHNPVFSYEQLSDIVFYSALGVIIGGRLGYMIFYDANVIVSDPLIIFQTWKGGMSFHGGLIGVMIALLFCTKKVKANVLQISDFIAPVVPFGLAVGRIGNFINGELWGRVSDVPWAMIFPHAGPNPRHPSQLYEFFLEGVILFIVVWAYSRRPKPLGAVSGLFALSYGVLRTIAECFREPDAHIGYFWGYLTQGQLLSLPLLVIGIGLLIFAYKRNVVV